MRPERILLRGALCLALPVVLASCSKQPSEYRWDLPTPPASEATGPIRVQIHEPSADLRLSDPTPSIEVRGAVYGPRTARLDLILALDSSNSLQQSDPRNYRSAKASALVDRFPPQGDVRLGVVDFDWDGELVQPLTSDRTVVIEAIRRLDQFGATDIAGGIRVALAEFERAGRPGASRVILLLSDGKSSARRGHSAMLHARRLGIPVSTVLLGDDAEGATLLRGIARGTGGRFARVADTSEVFASLSAMGVDSVTLRVNDSSPVPARLVGGRFTGQVPLHPGENRIEVTAIGHDGRRGADRVTVQVRPPGCAELKVRAVRHGEPEPSLSDRAVEIVFDASRSMWGRVEGRPKIDVAKEVLAEVFDSAAGDLSIGLRAYGHRQSPDLGDCRDSELLVPIGSDRKAVLSALSSLRPLGRTPLAHALHQIERDFGDRTGARDVVLVTDGIETCGGDPVQAARVLGARGMRVHVVGFGLRSQADEDPASLRAIAQVSGGRFLVASDRRELRSMLGRAVGRRFEVFKGETLVADGAIGAAEGIRLPRGAYRVRIESSPPREVRVGLAAEAGVTLVLHKQGDEVAYSIEPYAVDYASCTVAHVARRESPAPPASPRRE